MNRVKRLVSLRRKSSADDGGASSDGAGAAPASPTRRKFEPGKKSPRKSTTALPKLPVEGAVRYIVILYVDFDELH